MGYHNNLFLEEEFYEDNEEIYFEDRMKYFRDYFPEYSHLSDKDLIIVMRDYPDF